MRRDLEEARRPEVADLEEAAVGDEDVRRPKVAVDDALLVPVIDRIRNLAGVIERLRQFEGAAIDDDRLERLARDVLHHDEEDVVLLLRGDDRDDVRMVEGGQEPRLRQLAEVESLTVRNLDGDTLVDPRVLGKVDGAEPATAERLDDPVLAECLASEDHVRKV